MQTAILFGDFINKELSWGRNLVSNSVLQLEEMYQDRTFMKKPHAQLNLVKLKRPTLLKYLYYFQEKMPHVTQVHKKMECLLHFLTLNASGSDNNFSHKFSCKEKKKWLKLPHQHLRPPILKYPSMWKIGPGQQQARFVSLKNPMFNILLHKGSSTY